MDDFGSRERQLTGEVAHLRARLALYEAVDRSLAERFISSLDQMLDCFGIFSALRDGQGRITDFRIDYLNRAAVLSNQMPLEQQLGRGLCEILPSHRTSGLFDRYCAVTETGRPLELESVDYEDDYGGRVLARAFEIRPGSWATASRPPGGTSPACPPTSSCAWASRSRRKGGASSRA